MKRVVFGEGKHDAHFMCMVMSRCCTNISFDWFIAESIDDSSDLKPAQEPAVREFVYDRDTGILIKSEEGENNLRKLVGYYSEYVLDAKFDCIIVSDLDHGGVDELISSIDQKMHNYYSGKITIPDYSLVDSDPPLRLWNLEFKTTLSDDSAEVPLLTFDIDLEDAAGIDYADTWYQRSIDLNNFSKQQYVIDIVRQAL